MRREIEGHGEALLTRRDILFVELVGLLGCGEAGVSRGGRGGGEMKEMIEKNRRGGEEENEA